jgi:hypothetical protein
MFMSKAAKTLLVQGIYYIAAGLGFLVTPNLLLALFGFDTTDEPWIRTTGMLAAMIGFYLIQAGRHELAVLFPWTVYARAAVFVVFIGLVCLGYAQPMLLLFGLFDLLGATWTYTAIRS